MLVLMLVEVLMLMLVPVVPVVVVLANRPLIDAASTHIPTTC